MNELYKKAFPITDIELCSCQYPALALDAQAQLYACWQSYAQGKDAIFLAKITHREIVAEPLLVSGDGQALQAQLHYFAGRIWVLWTESYGASWRLLIRSFVGECAGESHCLAEAPGLFFPELTDDGHRLHLVWSEQADGNSVIMHGVYDPDGSWQKERASEIQKAYRPCIRRGGDNRLYLAYDAFDGLQYHILARVKEGDGAFGKEQRISEGQDWAAAVSMAATRSGVSLVWHDLAPRSETNYWTAELGFAQGSIHSQRNKLANYRVWYAGAHLAQNGGQGLLLHALDMKKLMARWRRSDDQAWSAPVLMVAPDMLDCAIRPCAVLRENGEISIAYQYAHGNGHKERLSAIYLLHTSLAELSQYDDTVEEQRLSDFTQPIAAPKSLERVAEPEALSWLARNGYEGLQAFYGDIHGHSSLSDGSGQADQFYHYAQARAHLDFTALTEHDAFPDVITASEWDYICTAANQFNRDGKLATLLAYEWTSNEFRYDFGHKNIYYRTPSAEMYRCCEADGLTPDRLFERVKRSGGLAIPHHTSATWGMVSAATDWDFHDEEVQRLVEIFSRHAPFERDGAQSPFSKNHPRLKGKYVQDALKRGYRLAFTAGSDSHQMECGVEGGIIVAFLPALNRENLFAALYQRFVYATTGAGILVSLQLNGAKMGGELTLQASQSIRLAVDVLGTDRLVSVELLRDNQTIAEKSSDDQACRFLLEDTGLSLGRHFYYVRVTQADRHMAWSSPIFVEISAD